MKNSIATPPHLARLVRPGTDDHLALLDVMRDYSTYPVGPGDIALDLGAHVGFFSVLSAARGAAVIAVEPERRNFERLTANTIGLNVMAICAAVTSAGFPTKLWVNIKNSTMINSLERRRGREGVAVQGVSFHSLLNEHNPSVIKCDIEGGEYDLLPEFAALPASIRLVMLELHFHRRPNWRFELAPKLAASLDEQFTPVKPIVWPRYPLFAKVGIWTR